MKYRVVLLLEFRLAIKVLSWGLDAYHFRQTYIFCRVTTLDKRRI